MKKYFSVILMIICLFSFWGCDKPKTTTVEKIYSSYPNEEFSTLEDELFMYFLGTDPMSINFNLYYPEVYHLENCAVLPYEFSLESENNYFKELKAIKEELESYTISQLTQSQYLDQMVLLDYVNRTLAFDGFYYYGTNLGSYLGYQAQLPSTLAEYRFDDKNDINNYLEYLKITQDIFAEIVQFENEKIALGMGLSDVIIDRVIKQCVDFISGETNYLSSSFPERLDHLTSLSTQEKLDYIQKNEEYINDYFIPAYKYLKNELEKMKGNTNLSGALANYDKGRQYYEVLFQDATGSNMSIPEVKAYLNKLLKTLYSNYYSYMANGSLTKLDNINMMDSKTLDTLIPFFVRTMTNDFPSLNVDLTYEINEVDESLQENSSPAFYFVSPIDDNLNEVIYINPKNFSSNNNYMYQTIAHEGYPGHLYQNVFMKNCEEIPNVRKILDYSGYAEGWATYVEHYVVQYAPNSNSQMAKVSEVNDGLTYIILGLCDIGINYDGWTMNQFNTYINQYFQLNIQEVEDMYYDLIEVPTNYLMYYFSCFQIEDLKESFQNKMGSKYSDYLFHQIYLETGPCSWDILKFVYDSY